MTCFHQPHFLMRFPVLVVTALLIAMVGASVHGDEGNSTPKIAIPSPDQGDPNFIVPKAIYGGPYDKRREWVMDQAVKFAEAVEALPTSKREALLKKTGRASNVFVSMALFERGKNEKARKLSRDYLIRYRNLDPAKVHATDFFAIWPAMCLVSRWEPELDPEALAAFKKYVTSINQYNRSFTPNLTMIMCTTKYLGDQTWGPGAFVKQLTEPLPEWGYRSITLASAHDRLMEIAKKTSMEGGPEYASRPYGFPNVAPFAALACYAKDKDLRDLAAFTHQVTLARYAVHWLDGNLCIPSGRSYPDYWNDPTGVARWFWTHFGGKVTPNKFYGEDMLAGAVFNQGPNGVTAEASRDRSSNFTVKSRFNWDAGAHQMTYFTPSYAVFSNIFTAPNKSFSQTYPTGVRWIAPQTGPISMLWLTVPCYDSEQRERQVSRPHGVHGSGQSTMINKGTLLCTCDTTGVSVNNKHALCFVPSGALAVINDSATNRHVFLHYPGVLISIASTAPFVWNQKSSVTLPCSKIGPEDSEFRIKADQFAVAIDTERDDAVQGATPLEKLENFRKLVLEKTRIQIKTGKPAVGTYMDHHGEVVQRTLRGAAIVNGKPVDLDRWPMSESPWTYQAFQGDKFELFNKNLKITYDLKTFTIREGKP